MNVQKYVAGILVGVVFDYILYTIIQASAEATGWVVFAAYNVGLVSFLALGIRSVLKGDRE
jgi:hypothetical protein